MRLQTFKNMKGLIHGGDPKRIGCDMEGVLRIGSTEITIYPGKESIMPQLFYGADGDYRATFIACTGEAYDIDKVSVRGGWIAPPPPTALEFMELRCRADAAEAECQALREKICELESIFDTDSLNFLIK